MTALNFFVRGGTARGSTIVLGTLRQGLQQQPSANTKRGKQHAALKAGLWDEPPQLARALVTGSNRFDNQRPAKSCELARFQAALLYPHPALIVQVLIQPASDFFYPP